MGFRPPVTTVNVEWPESHRLHGLHVKARSVTVDKYNEIMRLMFGTGPGPDPAGTPRDQARQAAESSNEQLTRDDKVMAEFASCLISWNYEDPVTGEPLPANREGIGRADPGIMSDIIGGWVSSLVSVPAPLDRPSPNGKQPSDSEEEALQLANLSRSLPS